VIPNYSIQRFWKTRGDPTFRTSGWHLSSDEQMNPAMAHGMSSHADVFFAWDQGILDEWHTNCTETHKSCSAGALGTTRAIKTTGFSDYLHSKAALTIPRARLGWSGPISGNGTFSGEFTAIDSGQLGLVGFAWTGEVTAFSLIDVTNSNNHAPITINGSH
jgi:hypothetical protein